MKVQELFETIERIPKGEASATYWAQLLSSQNPDRKSWTLNQMELEAALLDSAAHKFAVRNDDRIVGAVAFGEHRDSIHIEHIGSLSPGIGTELMNRVESFAQRKKLPMTLSPSNVSKSFYAKLGFEPMPNGLLRKDTTK